MNEIDTHLPKIGVSACLLGFPVRYDGRDKNNHTVTRELAGQVEFVPICPETGIGLGVPRPPIQLVGAPDRPKATGVSDPTLDVTDKLEDYARSQLAQYPDLSGFILKKKSPSCGMQGVPVHRPSPTDHQAAGTAPGIFARVLMELLPRLPTIEEDSLEDINLRGKFILDVYAYFNRRPPGDQGS